MGFNSGFKGLKWKYLLIQTELKSGRVLEWSSLFSQSRKEGTLLRYLPDIPLLQLSFYSAAHICYCSGSVFVYWSFTFVRFLISSSIFLLHKAIFTKPFINYQYCGLWCYVTLYFGKGLPNFVKKLTVQSLWRTMGAVVLCSSDTGSVIQTTQSDISEDHNANRHTRENLKFHN